ncbi:hypothetical protein GCM10010441_14390 [Kitasatospora paracochleata]|uniref:Proteinase inhibitor I42 chagasin domain-containing protein n=1 Tax=Kitasatospora paracochleata TaxID=58354 RepID=A0ABT1JAQ4_9ACTN|nr:hypothetical protein [Kitasatospora paracochleata]MCP2314463.1 hypothetical protein [Kitasatospora paracochleata]
MKTVPLKAILTLGLAVLGPVALTGCGPSGASGPVTAAGAAPVALDEGANHTRVTVAVGATVRTDLHSTYWSPVTSSDPNLLAPTGTPSTSAVPSCRPGAGCGTVTTGFVARATGSVRLTARRTSCGEAKPCPPDQQDYTVDVDVTP